MTENLLIHSMAEFAPLALPALPVVDAGAIRKIEAEDICLANDLHVIGMRDEAATHRAVR